MAKVTKADGNVFADLGCENAENLKLRAELMAEIDSWIKEHDYTEDQAAKALGTTQPRINEIRKGRLEKCTIDRLVKMLALAGLQVTMEVRHVA